MCVCVCSRVCDSRTQLQCKSVRFSVGLTQRGAGAGVRGKNKVGGGTGKIKGTGDKG